MLLTLLYHRVDSLQEFTDHLRYIKEHYPIVLPGDPLTKGKANVCLTFDDAYFDFYHLVYPLLRGLEIKALLAVPTSYIMDTTTLSPDSRLSAVKAYRFTYPHNSPAFCLWDEIKEMQDSGFVQIGSHSHMHFDMRLPNIDPVYEALESKHVLETKLGCNIESFVYPYGYFNQEIQETVQKHYLYVMRVGNALNYSWQNPIYRITAHHPPKPNSPFTFKNQMHYFFRYILNQSRNR